LIELSIVKVKIDDSVCRSSYKTQVTGLNEPGFAASPASMRPATEVSGYRGSETASDHFIFVDFASFAVLF